MSVLPLNLDDKELEYLKISVEKMLKDAQYFNRWEQEQYAKKLMMRIMEAEKSKREIEELNSMFGDIDFEEEII